MNMDYLCPNCHELIKLSLRAAALNTKRKCPVCGAAIDQDEVLRQRKIERQILQEQMEAEDAEYASQEARRRRWALVSGFFKTIYAVIKYSLLALILWFVYMFWQVAGWPLPWGK